ncbi:MAG: DUF2085 domain-containing protein, partial [Thermomicrobiaceae bacterium]|nr:DUF2085 domain-containing protein [Thermomicrobiaceae bacterium]
MSQPTRALSPRQERLILALDRGIYHASRRWLWGLNTLGALFVALAVLAPVLAATGHARSAHWIYQAFRLVCHERADRSFFIMGEKMAYCQRDTAIYGGLLLLGLVYPLVRERLRPLGLGCAVLLSLPMAVDGLTQLAGLRESTWELRVATGALFALAVSWCGYPWLDRGFA